MQVRPARADDHARLLEVWERSVRATHHFLTDGDVIALRPGAPAALRDELRTALLSLSQSSDGRKQLGALFHADGFVPAEDADYASLRGTKR